MKDLREPFPVTEGCTFLDVANHGPPSTPVKTAITAYLDDWDRLARHGDARVEQANESFARLIGAEPREIACQPNTSRGLATAAGSIPFERGDNVVVNDLENWANVYPWTGLRRRGVDVRVVRGRGGAVHLDDLEAAVDDRTKAVSISQVQWLTGARHALRPLAELAHGHGAYLVVDGIQAAGALRVDVKRDQVDFYACGSYKWLLGPSGAGFLYAREEVLGELRPSETGYRAVKEHSLEEPALKDTAQRLEFGEPSYLSFVGTKAGIDLILGLGPERIEGQVLRLSGRLYDGLSSLGVSLVTPEEPRLRSGVVSFATEATERHFEELSEEGFIVSLRPAGIRVSTGFYNTREEVDRLLERLAAHVKG
ncbi:MAG TPA: aminotransferase class V-fold PLP-dependent enzyme [Candidatus Bathyarchaeia archaeon]